MATSLHDSTHHEAGAGDYFNYFDVMLLGKTGRGKTTTADKILMANPTKKDYTYDPTAQDSVPAEPDNNRALHDANASQPKDASVSSVPGQDAAISHIRSSTQCHDLSMWHLSDQPDKLEAVTKRLKNLVFWRSLDNTLEEVNKAREKSMITERCELLSNDTSMVRVLDVPGFYGSNASSTHSTNVHDRVEATTENDLCIMRKILHIKMATNFKFNRIVYFLPDTGVLTRDSQDLQIEISIMENYFGRSIFESMVVVATHNQSSYKKFAKGIDLYTPEEIESTRGIFQKAMCRVFDSHDVPIPPIIFISLFDSCDDILQKIKESQVLNEKVDLCFNPFTCARCGIKIGKLNTSHKEENEDKIAICTDQSGSDAIPYDESTCHPMMIPKYHKIQCIVGGIVHIVTWKKFMGRWPYFVNIDEVCINCKAPPNERGCIKVGEKYVHKKCKDGIKVDHTSEVENYKVVPDIDSGLQRSDTDTMAAMEEGRVDETGDEDEA